MNSTKKLVLVVDDDPEIRSLACALLRRSGCEPVEAETATAAARFLRDQPPPDLLILDLMLPEVSGVEFLRQLRAKSMFAQLPVLVLSSMIEPEQIREALNAGADRYVTKPYMGTNLIPAVQDLLRSGRLVRS